MHILTKELSKPAFAAKWTKHMASLVGSSALPRYQGLTPTLPAPLTALSHFSPSQLGLYWTFTLLARLKSRRPWATVSLCLLSDCDQEGKGRPSEAAPVAEQPRPLSFVPTTFFIVFNLETLGRMCADFLPWGNGAIPALHLWYKNEGGNRKTVADCLRVFSLVYNIEQNIFKYVLLLHS